MLQIAFYDTAQTNKLLENVYEMHLMWEEFSQPQKDYIEETWQETGSGLTLK